MENLLTPTPNQTGDSMSDQTPTQTSTQSQTPDKTPMKQVTTSTTLKELIELGLIKSSQLTSWNKRLNRVNEKAADDASQVRANDIVSKHIIATFKVGFANRFRVKPIEKALLAEGVSRRMIEKSMKTLLDLGKIANNKSDVSNNCHIRHWVVEAPKVEETPEAEDSAE